jgi:hypothetical protein
VGTFALRHNKAFIVCKFKFGGCQNQGDQIGRIFAYRVTVYFGRFLKNYRSKLLGYFSGKFCVFIFEKKKLVGQYFGRFFHKRIWSP